MTAFQAFHRGWAAASRSKVALVLMWFTYALIAKIAAVPAVAFLLEPLWHSRMSGALLSHFEIGWLGDLFGSASGDLKALAGTAALAGVVTWLVAILFAGGTLTMLDERWGRFSFSRFLAAAGENFWRILRLSLFGLVCFALAWFLARLPVFTAKKIFGDGMEGWPIGVAGIVSSVLAVLLLGWVATVLDYAKVRLVSGHARGAFKALLRSFAFVLRHFSKTMGVWLMNATLLALLGAAYMWFSNVLQASTTATIVLLIVVQQAFIFFRTAQRIAAWGSALEIHAAFPPPVPPVIEPEIVTAFAETAPPESPVEAGAEPPEGEGSGI
jgi:hypothetical protein